MQKQKIEMANIQNINQEQYKHGTEFHPQPTSLSSIKTSNRKWSCTLSDQTDQKWNQQIR